MRFIADISNFYVFSAEIVILLPRGHKSEMERTKGFAKIKDNYRDALTIMRVPLFFTAM